MHTLQEVNDGLAHGRYFFMDVAHDGIALYESDPSELHQPKPKTPAQALAMAREYFVEWFPSAVALKEGADFYIGKHNVRRRPLFRCTKRQSACFTVFCWSARSTRRTPTILAFSAHKPNGLTRG